MSPINLHIFSRLHAHLRARFILLFHTCSHTSMCAVRICACIRAWEWSYVCNTRTTCIYYRGRGEPQMRMHTRIRMSYNNRRVSGLLNMRVCMRICRSFRVSYYIYVVYMSSTKVHLFSRVHAHLRARFVLLFHTCSRTSICAVRICACTRAREYSYVCNTRAAYIYYR